MNESGKENSSQRKRDSLLGQLIVAAAVILLVIVGIFAARTGINRKEVEARIATVEEGLNHLMEDKGYHVSFSYEDLDIGGGLFSKRVTIKNPVFQIEGEGTQGFYNGLTISSDRITLVPSDSEFSGVKLIFPQPVTVERGRQSWLITASDMAVIFDREQDDKTDVVNYTLDLNKSISIDSRESGKKTLLSFHEGSDVHGQFDLKQKLYSQEAYFTEFLLSQEQSFTLDGKEFKWDLGTKIDGANIIKHYKLTAESLAFQDEMEPLGTLKLAAEAEEAVPAVVGDGETRTRLVASKFTADSTDYNIAAEGNLQYQGSNLVPFGELNLHLTHPTAFLDALESSSLLNRVSRSLLTSALEFATRQKVTETSDKLNLTFRRNDGGAFIIGHTTFEELAAHVLRGLIDTDGTEPEEEAAPADKTPAPAPVTGGKATAPAAEPVPAAPAAEAAPAPDGTPAPEGEKKEEMKVPSPEETEKQINQIKQNMNDIGDVIESIGQGEKDTAPAQKQGE